MELFPTFQSSILEHYPAEEKGMFVRLFVWFRPRNVSLHSFCYLIYHLLQFVNNQVSESYI